MAHLVDHDLAGRILVADKVPPPMAWLNGKHKTVFDNPRVEFKSANLLNPGILINFIHNQMSY